jgi:fimbrial chaperone protein
MAAGKKHRFGVRSIGRLVGPCWLILGAAFAVPASAGSLKVNPVHINLPADLQSVSLKMTNGDASPVSVRVVTYAWTQAGGRDVYTPTTNVILSPPMFTIPGRQTQHVRIGLRNRAGSGAYRVIFEEIPRNQPVNGQIQINLRLNLPLYVLAKGRTNADVSWRAWRDASGEMIVEGRNRGLRHSPLLGLDADQGGRRHTLAQQMGVVLPGSARQWTAGKHPEFPIGTPLLLRVKGSAGETQTQIVLERG